MERDNTSPSELIIGYFDEIDPLKNVAELKLKNLKIVLGKRAALDTVSADVYQYTKQSCEDAARATKDLLKKIKVIVAKILKIEEKIIPSPLYILYLQHNTIYEYDFKPVLQLAEGKFNDKFERVIFLQNMYETEEIFQSTLITLNDLE